MFLKKFPKIYRSLENDAQYIFENDPAAQSVEEVMFSYPGFFAIAIYRLSHELFKKQNSAHSKNLDRICPQQNRNRYSSRCRNRCSTLYRPRHRNRHWRNHRYRQEVKIYQGVTLGALSVTKDLQDQKRHPTIEDHVVIYANATILGGETIIGENRSSVEMFGSPKVYKTKFGGISQRTSHGEEQIPGK